MKKCIFCEIIEGKKPSHKVHEDEENYAFLDINPRTKGHTLVVPKQHHETIMDMTAEQTAKLYKSVNKLAKAVYQATDAEGLNIIQNNKKVAGQVIDHVHVHIVPRTKQDNFNITGTYTPKEKELQKTREKIKKQL